MLLALPPFLPQPPGRGQMSQEVAGPFTDRYVSMLMQSGVLAAFPQEVTAISHIQDGGTGDPQQ